MARPGPLTPYALFRQRLDGPDDVLSRLMPGDVGRRAHTHGLTPFAFALAARSIEALGSQRTRQEQIAHAGRIAIVPFTDADTELPFEFALSAVEVTRHSLDARALGVDPAAYVSAFLLPERYRHLERVGRPEDFTHSVILAAAYVEQILTGKRPGAAAIAAFASLGLRDHRGRSADTERMTIIRAFRRAYSGWHRAARIAGASASEAKTEALGFLLSLVPELQEARDECETLRVQAAQRRRASRFAPPFRVRN